MRASFTIPWHKYALIVLLAEKMQKEGRWFGKTALQKFVYLLETVFEVPADYQYSLYIHGPFCSELMDDLDYVNFLGGVSVDYDPRLNGYSISTSHESENIKNNADNFLSKHNSRIEKLLYDFGNMTSRNLELCSTIVYIDNDDRKNNRNLNREEFIQEIKSIKPHFSKSEIESTVSFLEGKGYIIKR